VRRRKLVRERESPELGTHVVRYADGGHGIAGYLNPKSVQIKAIKNTKIEIKYYEQLVQKYNQTIENLYTYLTDLENIKLI